MPDNLTQLLDQIDRLEQEATKGPWDHTVEWAEIGSGSDSVIHGYYDGECPACAEKVNDDASVAISPEDREFIALARTALPQLAKALRDIMEIHKPFYDDHYYNGMDGESLHRFVARCEGCHHAGGIEDYPCPTVQAITDALGADGD